MKRALLSLLVLVGLLVVGPKPCGASSIGDAFDATVRELHVGFLNNIAPIYYRSLKFGVNATGLQTTFASYGPFRANAAYIKNIDNKDASPYLGGSIQLFDLVGYAIPQSKSWVQLVLPQTAATFADHLTAGFIFGHSFDRHEADWGFTGGLSYQFGS